MRFAAVFLIPIAVQGLLLTADPKKEDDKGPKVDEKAYKKEWRKEWDNGDFPSWKETYPKEALQYEDRQSDGKIGNFLQAEPKKKDEEKGPKVDEKAYKKEWRKEWSNGDFPSRKETYPKAALQYEDRQSDGKIGTFLQVEQEKGLPA